MPRKRIRKWLNRIIAPRPGKLQHITDPNPEETMAGETPYAAGGTHQGLVRPNNEDRFLCDTERGLFIVADGMGGHVAGEQASQEAVRKLSELLTVEQMNEMLSSNASGDIPIADAIAQANEAILTAAAQDAGLEGMGSTVVLAILRDSIAHIANVGDSRAYLIRGYSAQLLTRDHSVAAFLAEQEQIHPEDVRIHPLRNQLTSVLGLQTPPQVHYAMVAIQPSDRIVLCSDGLWDMLPSDEIACIVNSCADPREAVYELIRSANKAGGHDNITAVVIMIGPAQDVMADQDEAETSVQIA